MTTDRNTVVLATAVLLASWLMSGATSRPQVSAPVLPGVAQRSANRDMAIDSLTREVSQEASRLRERLAEAPTPRRSGRDPFRFGAAPVRRPVRRAPASVEAEGLTAAYAAPASVMPFKLIGISENRVDEAGPVERKAILSGDGQLLIVGIDESLGTRYLVVAIGADAVELFDATTNQPVRLVLR